MLTRNDAPFAVQIVPRRRLNVDEVRRSVARAERLGEGGRIVTSALSPIETDSFVDAGFTLREDLILLRHGLVSIPTARPIEIRNGRRNDTDRVLSLDRRSFDDFWTIDRHGLRSARNATPRHRYRVALGNHPGDSAIGGRPEPIGYAITGLAGGHSYFQRLGVEPTQRRAGVGSALVIDALLWARTNGAHTMLVNTQTSNLGAASLYRSLGFVESPDRLHVLEWPAPS